MKATELMIGDWVTGKKWRELPFQITCINDSHKFIYGKTVNSTVGPFFTEELEPIPLTPEILKRNGFRYFEDANAYILMTDDLNCVVLTLNGLTVIFHWNNLPIMYAHQLQHVLRLCGLNELADNIKLEDKI